MDRDLSALEACGISPIWTDFTQISRSSQSLNGRFPLPSLRIKRREPMVGHRNHIGNR
jgi:hypothetical protein